MSKAAIKIVYHPGRLQAFEGAVSMRYPMFRQSLQWIRRDPQKTSENISQTSIDSLVGRDSSLAMATLPQGNMYDWQGGIGNDIDSHQVSSSSFKDRALKSNLQHNLTHVQLIKHHNTSQHPVSEIFVIFVPSSSCDC